MPEGDTIYRLAEQLRPRLLDAEVRRLHLHRTPPTRLPKLPTTVDEVRAVGKHLLITFGTGHVFDSHLKMNGTWDVHRPGGRWREPRGAMRALIETDDVEAVLFSTRDVRIYDPRDPSTKPWERLG
ncbi:MAG: DNA-formamidopyrimidine glycosylase family protein, partial [Actinomycetota bacterium]